MIFLQSHFFCDLDSRSESIWWMHPTGPRFEKWGIDYSENLSERYTKAHTWWSWSNQQSMFWTVTFRKLVWRGGQNPLVFSCEICIYIYISHDMCICRYLFMILKIIFRACILVIFWCADRSIYIYTVHTHTPFFKSIQYTYFFNFVYICNQWPKQHIWCRLIAFADCSRQRLLLSCHLQDLLSAGTTEKGISAINVVVLKNDEFPSMKMYPNSCNITFFLKLYKPS